jgi:hypothetical protein
LHEKNSEKETRDIFIGKISTFIGNNSVTKEF